MLMYCPFPVEAAPPRWYRLLLPGLVLLVSFASSTLSLQDHELSEGLTVPTVAASGSFKMSRLVTRAGSSRFELPIVLPPSFDLSLELWGDAKTLAASRVIGLPLRGATDAPPDAELETWHQIHINRHQSFLALTVDGRAIPVDPARKTTSWLSVEPPGGTSGEYRNIRLSW
jgi:hypothetical protein